MVPDIEREWIEEEIRSRPGRGSGALLAGLGILLALFLVILGSC